MAEPVAEQQRSAARHLLQQPLTCAERDPEIFAVIRRHEHELDRWFTQRLGYRLHVSTTTARLFKTTVVPHRRPLYAAVATPRPLTQREYTMLALALAAVASGPRVISLHDLIHDVRTAAADAEVTLTEEANDRRALTTALKWMIEAGLARELHEKIDRYAADAEADAIVEFDPDRVGLLPLPVLGRAQTAAQLLDRSDRRGIGRQWMRARIVEDPVLYRNDLDEAEWSELRRRLGEEDAMLEEMFGLQLESRAEGVAAIDANGHLSDRSFPTTATVGHAALLVLDELVGAGGVATFDRSVEMVATLANDHRKHWAGDMVGDPAKLLRKVLELLLDNRLVIVDTGTPDPDQTVDDAEAVDDAATIIRALPAAARFSVDVVESDGHGVSDRGAAGTAGIGPRAVDGQDALW